MLLQYLLVGILFYYIVKTSRKLIQAVRGELEAPSGRSGFDRSVSSRRPRQSGWQDGTSRSRTHRRHERWDEDIEDAEWEDL